MAWVAADAVLQRLVDLKHNGQERDGIPEGNRVSIILIPKLILPRLRHSLKTENLYVTEHQPLVESPTSTKLRLNSKMLKYWWSLVNHTWGLRGKCGTWVLGRKFGWGLYGYFDYDEDWRRGSARGQED